MIPFINFHTHHPAYEGEISLGAEEHGMDARWDIPLEEQERQFRQSICASEEQHKHLTIHCVRMLEHILRIRCEMKPRQPWVFHGFRGKPQQLQSLLSAGIYVSFGLRYNKESIQLCPLEMLCLETDDTQCPIKPLYEEIASLRGISIEHLQRAMIENARKITQNASFCANF